ncbi:MAG: arylsulfatase A [Blastopirellula sp.]|nr:MAG: arylsulfatase A [Blastopirellula sp.]
MNTFPLIALGLVVSVSLAIQHASAETRKRPNVVMIMADDIGFECFSSYGSKEYSTPRLDALAAAGIRFENCHSTPLCTPSRVNLMSGKSNVYNYQDFGVYPKGEPTFAEYFKKSGYATAVAGKWQLLTGKTGISPTEAGFDSYCVWNIPGTARERYWNPSLLQDGKLLEVAEDSYGPTHATDFLINFIEKNKDRPFLAYYAMILPHNPFLPTPDSKDRNEKDAKQNFIDMVNYMDKCVGRIVDCLEENKLRENTLVIFTGDNGTNANIISEFQGKPLRGGKGYTHDYGTHVPLIINWPGVIAKSQLNDDLICFSDFFPTMVEAAQLKPKKITDGDGWSFWPQCLGKPGTKRETIYGYYFPRPYAKKFDDKYNHWEVRYARDKRFKLYDSGLLYDTIEDVEEQSPISVKQKNKQAKAARVKLQAVLDSYPTTGGGVDYKRVTGTKKQSK